MLGQHPQLYGLPEVNLFVADTMRERDGIVARPRWSDHGLLRAVAQLIGGEQTVATVMLARRWIDMRADCSCVSTFEELAEAVSPRRLVDKSPRTVTRIDYLERIHRAFPGARFVHLVRHPRSQGMSHWKLGGQIAATALGAIDYGTDPPTVDFQKSWYALNTNVLVFLRSIPDDRQLRVRGEDVLADPETHLRRIAAWLGLRTDAEAVDAMLHPEQSPYACFGPATALFGNDPTFLREPALRRADGDRPVATLDGALDWRDDEAGFTTEVQELARELGYA
jgi:hypothetical protein